MGRGPAQAERDEWVQHQQLVPPGEVLQHQVATRLKGCRQASQNCKSEGKHGQSVCTESANHQRLPARMEFLLPTVTSSTRRTARRVSRIQCRVTNQS